MKKFFLFTDDETDVKVSNRRLLSHAAGLVGQNITYSFLSGKLFYFLNTILKLDSSVVGKITGLTSVWDAVNDPIFGAFIDNRKHRPGYKLRPFLLYLPPIIGLLVALMFININFSNPTYIVIYITVLYFLFDVFYSYHDTAIWGIVALSSPSSAERQRVIQWVTIAAGAGGTIVSFFPTMRDLLNNAGMSESNIFTLFGFIFGLGGMLLAMLAYRQKEKVISPQSEEKLSAKQLFKSIWNFRNNRTLIILCLARIVGSLSPSLGWEYFFESEGIGITLFGQTFTRGMAQNIYGTVMGIPGAITSFFTVIIIRKLGGNKKTLVIAEAINIATRIIAFSLGTNDRFKSTSTILMVMALLGSAQIFTNLKGVAERSLLTNSIDEMEYKTGERTEGITFSMQNFVSKLTSAIPKFIQGYLLKFLRFDQNLGTGGSDTILKQTSARFLKYRWHQFVLGPVVGAALYLLVILFVKDDPKQTAYIEAQLQAKREAATEEAGITVEA